MCKNRYTDVLCLDQSRVVLSCIDDDPSTDYINANFVDGYKQKNAYISTQGVYHHITLICLLRYSILIESWKVPEIILMITDLFLVASSSGIAIYFPRNPRKSLH